MPVISIVAETTSRLHADLAIVRLLRAGLAKGNISAVFSRRRAPNSVCCWLSPFTDAGLRSRQAVCAAGRLGVALRGAAKGAERSARLAALGLPAGFAEQAVEVVETGRILVCVHTRSEDEAAIAWHIFQHVGAENIGLPHQSQTPAPAMRAPVHRPQRRAGHTEPLAA